MKKSISVILMLVALSSCYSLPPCNEHRKRFFDKEVNIVITDRGPRGNSFHVKGINTANLKKSDYFDSDGIYNFIWNDIEVGDTLFKTKGNDLFILKKRNFNLLIKYNCNSSAYGNTKVDTIQKYINVH